MAHHPDNTLICRNVVVAVEHMNRVIIGPFSVHYELCAQEVEAVLADPTTPAIVRAFLRDLAKHLRQRANAEHREEEDERINW